MKGCDNRIGRSSTHISLETHADFAGNIRFARRVGNYLFLEIGLHKSKNKRFPTGVSVSKLIKTLEKNGLDIGSDWGEIVET